MLFKNNKSDLFYELLELMGTIRDLQDASSLLSWDSETYMPKGGYDIRSSQIATLDTIAHKYMTSDSTKSLVDKLRSIESDDDIENKMYKLFIREFDYASKLPEKFVSKLSKLQTLSVESWSKAKQESNFQAFSEYLTRIVDMKVEQAEHLGYETNCYDALLDYYEPELTTNELNILFDGLKNSTTDIIKTVKHMNDSIDESFLYEKVNKNDQIKFSKYLATKLNFDFVHGRIDESIHPFTVAISPKDVRLTTKTNENDFRSAIFSTIHEVGHGLYEQGIDYSLSRTFAASGASFGIHESQSLLWENIICRSREFWIWCKPYLNEYFSGLMNGVSSLMLFKAFNKVQPSFIRIESDETSYNLHILIRYEIEKDLINGVIKVKDVPEIWNHKMKTYLGILPKNDAHGCLQDIHWSHGSFGYFPTYTIGKLYAAMIWNVMSNDIQDINDLIINGKFTPIRQWLKENIHYSGKLEKPKEIINRITGKDLSVDEFLIYITNKVKTVYEL